MAADSVQEVVEYSDADTTAALAHWCHHAPLTVLGVVTLDTRDGIPAAPTTNWDKKTNIHASTFVYAFKQDLKSLHQPLTVRENKLFLFYIFLCFSNKIQIHKRPQQQLPTVTRKQNCYCSTFVYGFIEDLKT